MPCKPAADGTAGSRCVVGSQPSAGATCVANASTSRRLKATPSWLGIVSMSVSALATADALAVIAEADDQLPAGAVVDMWWLDRA